MSGNGGSNEIKQCSETALKSCAKLAVLEDKPIMFDYWLASLEGKVVIGVKETKEKLLVKSEDEYTSPISKIYKTGEEFIIMTENSIYIVSNTTKSKSISS